jgi:hypothetical protein
MAIIVIFIARFGIVIALSKHVSINQFYNSFQYWSKPFLKLLLICNPPSINVGAHAYLLQPSLATNVTLQYKTCMYSVS